MKWSQSHIFTLRDDPADADIPSQALMVRAGMIRKVSPGIYTYGTLALKAIRKFENIIREELGKISCNEILMPMVQPKELWEETHREEIPKSETQTLAYAFITYKRKENL